MDAWNANCSIFLGNFTPKTSNWAALKIGHLAFQVVYKWKILLKWIFLGGKTPYFAETPT